MDYSTYKHLQVDTRDGIATLTIDSGERMNGVNELLHHPQGDPNNISNSFAYATCWLPMDILKRSGDNLTHENIIRQAQNIDMEPPMYLPGVRFRITATDFDPIKRFQMVKFDGTRWQDLGNPIGR